MTVTVVMPMDRWPIMTGAYILSIPSTSMSRHVQNLRTITILGILFTLGASSDAFFVMNAEKLAILAGPISTFLPVRELKQSSQPQSQHTTTNMIRRRHTLHRLCPLSPWQQPPRTQLMVPPLPISPGKAHGVGFALAIVCSLVWGAKKRPIKK